MFPENLRQYLNQFFVDEMQVKMLHGKSGAGVWRIYDEERSLIVKQAQNSNEALFYRHAAPLLREHIAIPALYFIDEKAPGYWLVIEDVPAALEVERGHFDKAMITQLARLHCLPVDTVPASVIRFQPLWTHAMTQNAFQVLPDSLSSLRVQVEQIQSQASSIFEKLSLLSGDPNPANWGVCSDGTRVLYDWERFTCGTPAIDLAITVPGLGTSAQFDALAEVYLKIREQLGHPYSVSVNQLARDVAASKLWTVIEYLTLYHDGKLEPDATLQFIIDALPAWLKALET